MSNPFKPHALNLFADRGNIDEAMDYARALILTLPNEHRPAVMTALMVVVNTAAKVWPEAPAQVPIPAPGTVELELRLEALASRVVELEHSKPTVTDAAVQVIRAQIREWADDNFNDFADDWLRNHADLDNEIENWMENNMDVENEVREVLSSANLSITF